MKTTYRATLTNGRNPPASQAKGLLTYLPTPTQVIISTTYTYTHTEQKNANIS
jgi:hypothetical protein